MTDLRHFQHGNLPGAFRQMLIDVHADAYADQMDDLFHQRFAWFVDHWTGMDGFSCVVAYDEDEPVGFPYGAPLAPAANGGAPPRTSRTTAVPPPTRSPK